MTQRFKITVEYDGGPFVGWQRQPNGPSVQQALEEAVTALSGEEPFVQGAGRTDSGVHALAQVAHFDLEKEIAGDALQGALNHHLKAWPVSVLSVEAVSEDFHARFSATGRAYLYRILNRRAQPALDEGRVWWVPIKLDAQRMQEAAQVLVGHHDFSSFRAAECQANSPVKTLDRLDVSRQGEEIVVIAEARSFLHHQVRNMVGSLKLVGQGRWSAGRLKKALEARDRRAAGPTAPAEGLYLTRVTYD
jgi:tRNA pseudouridine38-40 synthase